MLELARGIRWIEGGDAARKMAGIGERDIEPLSPGLEAEVALIRLEIGPCVLKIWNRDSKPDIGFQYRLLKALHDRGMRVPRPLAWGVDASGHQALLTSYDGAPVREADADKLRRIAGMLLDAHRCRIDEPEPPRYDFVSYFFPGIDAHPDLAAELARLVGIARPQQDAFIHGDYNFNNVLEAEDGRLTVIDWTNGQLGDARYDIGWSVFLADLYTDDALAGAYRSAFLSGGGYRAEELEPFEAIGLIRWLLLDRTAGMPRKAETEERLRNIMAANRYISRMERA
jgi:Ser/Thr protein kinase RdoA (MazF antagonist)